MPISWNEIKSRALQFSHEWADVASEDAEAKSFWDAFFNVFGVPRKRVASFETRVKKIDGKDGYIDLLWKGILLIEHNLGAKIWTALTNRPRTIFPVSRTETCPVISSFPTSPVSASMIWKKTAHTNSP
jgi:hypothetical protein